MPLHRLASAFTLLFCAGCSSFYPSKPAPPPFQPPLVEELTKVYSDPAAFKVGQPITVAERNRILDDLIYLIDVQYSAFEERLYERRADFNTLTDFAVLGLSGTGALMTPVNTVRILSGISAAVTGARASIDSNYFQEKSSQALISSMQAARATRLAAMREAMDLPVEQYDMGRGLSDIEAYYNAGTLIGALESIVKDAGAKKTAADTRIDKAMTSKRAATVRPPRDRIVKWLAADATRVPKMVEWLASLDPPVATPPGLWANADTTTEEQLNAAIEHFHIP